MNFLYIFLLGASSGVILSIISMLIISASNSEKYPVGGFIPSLWMITELGVHSQIIVAGILTIGGMTGFYLVLTFWKENPLKIKYDKIQHRSYSKSELENNNSTITVKGKSLAEFL